MYKCPELSSLFIERINSFQEEGGGINVKLLFHSMGHGVSFGGDENLGELESGDGYINL